MTILVPLERNVRTFSTPRWCKYSSGANHTIGEMAGLIVIQQFLQCFVKHNYDKYLKNEYNYLYKSLSNIITEQGAYLEHSSNYTILVAQFLYLLDLFVSSIGSKKANFLYDNNYLVKMLNYIKVLSLDGSVPDFGDNDAANALLPFCINRRDCNHLNSYLNFKFPNNKIKNSLCCKESGHVIWKSNDEYYRLFVRCGKHSFLRPGNGSHAHNDILAILLAIGGKEVLIDRGTLYYNSGLDILKEDRSTKNHNTISVGNAEQADISGKWIYSNEPNCKILKCDICREKLTFIGECKYKQITHNRQINSVNSTISIIDNIYINDQCQEKLSVSCNFLLAEDITPRIEKKTVALYRADTLVAKIKNNDNVKVNINEVTYCPSYGISAITNKITMCSNINRHQVIKTDIEIVR